MSRTSNEEQGVVMKVLWVFGEFVGSTLKTTLMYLVKPLYVSLYLTH